MELLKRKYLNESKNIIKIGTDFKREFTLSQNVVEFSIMVPLMILKEIDYFTINYNEVKNMQEFNDVVFEKNGLFELQSMEVINVSMMDGKHNVFAKLLYSGRVEKHESFIAYPTIEVRDTKGWRLDAQTISNDYIRTFY